MNSYHSREEQVCLNSSDAFEILNIEQESEQQAIQEYQNKNKNNGQSQIIQPNKSNTKSKKGQQKDSLLSKDLNNHLQRLQKQQQNQVSDNIQKYNAAVINYASVTSDHSDQHLKRKLSEEQAEVFQNLRKVSIDDENNIQSYCNQHQKRKNIIEVALRNAKENKLQIINRQSQMDFQMVVKRCSGFKKEDSKQCECQQNQDKQRGIKNGLYKQIVYKIIKKQAQDKAKIEQELFQMELSGEEKVHSHNASDRQISINPTAFSTALHNVISIIEKGTENQVISSKQEWEKLFKLQSFDDYKFLNSIIKMKRRSQQSSNQTQSELKNQKNLKYFWQEISEKANKLKDGINEPQQDSDSRRLIIWKKPKIVNIRAIKMIQKAMVKIRKTLQIFISEKSQLFESYAEWIKTFLNQYSSLDIEVGYSKGIQFLPMGVIIAYSGSLTYDIFKSITVYLLTFWNLRKMYLPGSPLLFPQIQKMQFSISQKIMKILKKQDADFTRLFFNYFRTMMCFKMTNKNQQNRGIIKQFMTKVIQLVLIDGINAITVLLTRMINIRQEKILNIFSQSSMNSYDASHKADILNYFASNIVVDFLLQKIEQGSTINQIFNDLLIINE